MTSSKTPSNLTDWLLRIESYHPEEIELGLARIGEVFDRLELNIFISTAERPVVVTFAGTNGKGSTLGLLEQAAVDQGVKVFTYTSPHILKFNERIRISACPVDDELLCDAFDRIEAARQDIPLTYFEFTTLAAFLIVQWQAPELILLEVGLGGRLDAVNLVDADIAVITSIAFDHQSWLGDTLEAIACEKAGILRPGKPLVSGLKPPIMTSLMAAVERLDCPYYGQPHMAITSNMDSSNWTMKGLGVKQEQGLDGDCYDWQLSGLPTPNIPMNNAMVALQVWYLLVHKFSILNWSVDAIHSTLKKVQVPGRWQRLSSPVPTFLDVAHNVEATEYLKQKILEFKGQSGVRRVISLFGVMRDKDLIGLVSSLTPCVDLWVPLSLSVDRAASVSEIDAALKSVGANVGDPILHFESEWSTFQQSLDPEQDMLVCWGSFFVLAEVLRVEALQQR